MSVLTKVFVVLVAILSVVLVAVMVTFVANQEHWKQQYEGERSKRLVADTMARRAQHEQDAGQDQENQRISQLGNERNALIDKLMVQEEDLATARAEVVTLKSDKIRLEGSLARSGIGTQILAETNKQQRGELGKTRDVLTKAKTDLIQTTDLLNQKMTRIEILEQELRYNQERLTELIEENTELASRVQTAGLGSAQESDAVLVSPIRIEGGVTRVEQVEDATYVQLDVGSVDGVAQGMEFMVHHDVQFKGMLVIDLVDDRSSSGKMTLVQGPITAGDQVVAGANY